MSLATPPPSGHYFDCIVIGSGNAGSCAAIAAKDAGCTSVLLIDKCPQEWAGGNGYFTAGAHRTVHAGLADLLPLVKNVDPNSDLANSIVMEPYTKESFTNDILRLQVLENGGKPKSDMKLVNTLVDESREAIQWLSERIKMPFTFSFNRQAYLLDGKQTFWGGMVLSVEDGGKGVIVAHQTALKEAGVEMWFESPAVQLIYDRELGKVNGVVVRKNGELVTLKTEGVILACGGFEASRDLRRKYLGAQWEKAKVCSFCDVFLFDRSTITQVRGTPYNTGDGLAIAVSVGAKLTGDFKSCHSTCWDANAPADTGDRLLSNQFTKSGYPLGLMLNAHGRRFVNEGEDFRNYTYVKFGREILMQPNGVAFQVWDSKTTEWLREEEYGDDVVKKVWGNSLEELSQKLAEENGLEDPQEFVKTIEEYNKSVLAYQRQLEEHGEEKHWDPAIKDGLSTLSLSPPKSNWALTIDEPPFLAVKVTCGITFTFGGLAIDPDTAAVLSEETGKPIEGLYCTGELVGGLFYGNYPGGSGLTAGCIFGRKAGSEVGKSVLTK